jgi:nitronate monooxygenase
MGIGISNHVLAGTVSAHGGLGVLSSAALDRLVSDRTGVRHGPREATEREVKDAKELASGKPLGINVMVAVRKDYRNSILGALDGGVDVIISGAGLPNQLPEIAAEHPRGQEVALVPIVSSGRALELICRKWQRQGRLPDAVVVEGPMAGGHIAWREVSEADDPNNSLESLLPGVIEASAKHGGFPVIAAGGVYTRADIERYLAVGCAGVQMGTRFLATYESGASEDFKRRLLSCKSEDITLAQKPGSPCQMLFRIIDDCPFYQEAIAGERPEHCNKGYLLHDGKCLAKADRGEAFCICNGLLASCGQEMQEKELYTVGANAHRVDRILHVSELMAELV